MEGSKSINKRRALTHRLVCLKVLGLVYVRRWKKRDRKIVRINIGLFCVWWTDAKKFSWPKRNKNKDEPWIVSESTCRGNWNAFWWNQPLFKRADLGKYLDIENIKNNFKYFPSHYIRLRSGLEWVGLTTSLRKTKNSHDIFINLDGSIEMAVRSKKAKVVALVKWLTRKA